MWEGLQEIGIALDQFNKILKSIGLAISALGDSTAAKLFVAFFVIICVLYVYRRVLLRPGVEPSESGGRSKFGRIAFGSLTVVVVVLIGITLLSPDSKKDVADRTIPEPTRNRSRPPIPGTLTCAQGNCGVGGPMIDPKVFPQLLSKEDRARYFDSLATSPKAPSVCLVYGRAGTPSLAFYDIDISLTSGSTCQRFYEASASAASELSLELKPKNGTVTVSPHSFKYSPKPNYRGSDSFFLKHCYIPDDGRGSCTNLRYFVEVQ